MVETHPLPLWTTPLGCLVQVVTGASLQVFVPRLQLGCHAFAWSVGCTLLSLLRLHCGTKGIALCGVLLPSTPLWNVLTWLCAAALRYSSLMFQVPHWTSDKALEYPLWFLRAPSPPVRCCLPAPFLLSVCVVSLCPCLVLPLLLCLLSSCVDIPYFPGLVCDYLPLFVFGRLSCDLSCYSGALVPCLCDEFVFHFLVLLSHSGLLRFPPPSLCFCFSGLGGLSVFGCVLVGPFFWFCFG